MPSSVVVNEHPAHWGCDGDARRVGYDYTTIGPNATFTMANGVVPIRLDIDPAATFAKGVVKIPVLKIDTAAAVVTPASFQLAEDVVIPHRIRPKLVVETEGTTQTVSMVAEPFGLILTVR